MAVSYISRGFPNARLRAYGDRTLAYKNSGTRSNHQFLVFLFVGSIPLMQSVQSDLAALNTPCDPSPPFHSTNLPSPDPYFHQKQPPRQPLPCRPESFCRLSRPNEATLPSLMVYLWMAGFECSAPISTAHINPSHHKGRED